MVTDSMNARDRLRAVIPGPWNGWLTVRRPSWITFPSSRSAPAATHRRSENG